MYKKKYYYRAFKLKKLKILFYRYLAPRIKKLYQKIKKLFK